MTCDSVTTPIAGFVWSTPPIVYAVVVMFVCGGFEDLLQRLGRRREVRAELAQARGQALRERAAVEAAAARRTAAAAAAVAERPLAAVVRAAVVRAAVLRLQLGDARLHRRSLLLRSAGAGSAGSGRFAPPVFSFATIFGTTPSWCSARSVSPSVTCATPSIAAICFAAVCWNVSCVPGRKKSWTKCVPGLPSFERSVITDWFACSRSRLPPPPPGPKPPPESCCGCSVTVRSVPMPASGLSVLRCARSRPLDRLVIATTSATPSPSPSSVRIVRVRRRTSSLRRYRT